MEGSGALVLAFVFVVLPWLVLGAMALTTFNFLVAIAMLFLFSFGILLLSTVADAS